LQKIENQLLFIKKTYADSLVYDGKSDFKLSTKILNDYQKNERQLQQYLSELILLNDVNNENNEEAQTQNTIIPEIRRFFTSIGLSHYEKNLIEIKKQCLHTLVNYIKTNVIKDDILMFDFSSTKK